MNTLVVYFSLFGNTRRVAEAMAEGASQAGEARSIHLDELTPPKLQGVDVLIMGSPTHIQNIPKAVREMLETFPKGMLKGKWVAAFDTSVEMWGPLMRLTAGGRLLRKLRKLGGKKLAKAETFLVEKSDQRDGEIDLLYQGELERAKTWAAEILQQAGSK